jgi:hypothetical protein
MAVRLSVLSARRPLTPENFWYSFMTFLCRDSLRFENYFKGSSQVKRLRKTELDYSGENNNIK